VIPRGRLVALAALATAFVVALVMALRARAAMAYEGADVARLRAIEAADASLGVKVLEARAGLLPHFDPLVRAVFAMHDAERFAGELRARGGDLDDVAHELDAFAERARGKEQSIETLKSDLALLRSSSRYFPVAAAALARRGDDVARQIEALRDDVERFQAIPSRAGADRIGAELAALDAAHAPSDDAARADLVVVSGHARAIVERRERVDRLARAVAAGPSAELARGAYEQRMRRSAVVLAASSVAAVLLGIAALAFGAVVLLAWRRQNEGLIRAPRPSSSPRTRRSHDV
jgi:hypothetical protein